MAKPASGNEKKDYIYYTFAVLCDIQAVALFREVQGRALKPCQIVGISLIPPLASLSLRRHFRVETVLGSMSSMTPI